MIYANEVSGTIVSSDKIHEPNQPGQNYWTKFVIKQFAPTDTSNGRPKGKDQEYEVKLFRQKREDIAKYNIAPGKVITCNLGLYGKSYSTSTGLAYSLNLTVMQIQKVS